MPNEDIKESISSENFKLKVENICYDVLRHRDMTFDEAQKIKEATQESISILINEHSNNCEKRRKEEIDRFWWKAGIAAAIFGPILVAISQVATYVIFHAK